MEDCVTNRCTCVCLNVIDSYQAQCTHHENIYNFDPLKPHFYVLKLGLQVYTLFFLISTQKHKIVERR